jgi:hypothetical protein
MHSEGENKVCYCEGCNKYPQWECSGQCEEHAMQEQRDEKRKQERGVPLRDATNNHSWVAVDIVMGIMRRKSRETKKENEEEVCY